MQMIYFLSMPFDLDCVLEYLWNLKPKHTHTPKVQALPAKSKSPGLEVWNTDLFEVPQETGTFHL